MEFQVEVQVTYKLKLPVHLQAGLLGTGLLAIASCFLAGSVSCGNGH